MIDVVVCGNLRGELAAYEVLRELIRARDNGLVERLVFSTWHSELDRFPDLADALNAQGVMVVSQEPPEPYGGSLVIQQLQFWRGLQALPASNQWILKSRTDKALSHTTNLLANLAGGQIQLNGLWTPREVFDAPILVPGASVSELLAHNDLAILGRRNDLMRCLSFDAAFDYILNDQGYFPQEVRWFAAPILARWPELKDFFASVSLPHISGAIRRAANECRLAAMPEAVFQYLGFTIGLTRNLFGVFDHMEYGQPQLLENYFSFRALRPQAVNWGDRLIATSQSWLNALETTQDDPVGYRLCPHVQDSRTVASQIAQLDLESLNAFSGVNTAKAPPTRYRVSQAANGAGDAIALLRAFMRIPSMQENTDLLARLDAAIDIEVMQADHSALLQAARKLDAEARATGDPDMAFAAYSAYMCGAWGRVEEAMDGACALAFDGLIGENFKLEALETVYSIFVQDPSRPYGKFWHGFEHVYRFPGTPNEEWGWTLIRGAAEAGFKRAQTLLELRSPIAGASSMSA